MVLPAADLTKAARELALKLNPRIDSGCSRRYLADVVAQRGWSKTLRYATARVFLETLEAGLQELQHDQERASG